MVAIKEASELHEQIIPDFVVDTNDAAELLTKTRAILKRRLSFFVWQGFFEPLSAVSLNRNQLILEAPTSFHRNWVMDHYMVELNSAAAEAFGEAIKVVINNSTEGPKKIAKLAPIPTPSAPKAEPVPEEKSELASKVISITPAPEVESCDELSSSLSPACQSGPYTFESFVQGPSNQVAYTASLSVAEFPGAKFSPLFIFGGVGLGKTHLLQAIRHRALAKDPSLKVVYITAENWVNSYIQAVRERRFDQFRSYYRTSCDILLIDDVQFLAGKDASQDEFFHTFNCLHETKKQIVVTSDKYPHEIAGLEERLQTRLAWGLIADVRPPEMAMRMTILRQKSALLALNFSSEVLTYIASNFTNSVRELEGALVRVAACSDSATSVLDVAHAQKYLAPVIKKKSAVVSWKKICDVVAAYYDLKTEEVLGQSRQRQVAFARQMAMTCCRTLLSMSLPEIGRVFGGRDHTTVLSSLRKIEELKRQDVSLAAVITKLEDKIISLEQN
jgi:chromosomal replication initiator protein